MTVERLVAKLGLAPHPEGGYYRETYRASSMVSTPRGERPASTAIYFLLPAGSVSRLHRIQSDELWHFYEGGPLRIVELVAGESARETVLGPESPQHVVRAGTWFGAYPDEGAEYSFVGCTVAPGFDFADFELGGREQLLRAFPRAGALVSKLTALGVGLALLLSPGALSAEPGEEGLLDSRTVTASLYVTAVAYEGESLSGVELAWVPASLAEACRGLPLAECGRLKAKEGEVPTRVLTAWVTKRDRAPESGVVLKALSKRLPGRPAGETAPTAEHRYPTLELERRVKARVGWELWTNGENFRVLRVLR